MRKVGSVKAITHPTKPEQAKPLAETTLRPLVRSQVIAAHLDVHHRTVEGWAARGIVPSVKIGGIVRFNMEAVLGAIQ